MSFVVLSWAGWALWLGCSASEPAAPPPPPAAVPEAPAPVPAPEPLATPAKGSVRVLHHRLAKGQRTPRHVSATWVDTGLQLMLTGLSAPCEGEPSFSLVAAGDTLRLVQQGAEGQAPCNGSHTLMLQIDGLEARDLTVEVTSHDGTAFGSTEVRSTDH